MKDQINIHTGEYYATRGSVVIHTILGSCVGICLFDPLNRIGGMNHFLLPGRADMKTFNVSARYGINAMELLINRIMNLGGNRKYFIAKVFGGANVISSISKKYAIGKKNVSFALEFLEKEGIRILSKDVGGSISRKIYFHTDTGNVFLKRIPPLLQLGLAYKEAIKLQRVQKTPFKPGKITLFDD